MAKQRYSFLKILTGSDLSRRRVPLMSLQSPNDGPVVWITACGHGDEIGGMAIIHEVFKILKNTLRCGTVLAFPLMNPLGFEVSARFITLSNEDLNRSFPGDPKGSLGKRLADTIYQTIVRSNPDLVLDLHNDWIKSIPYVLLEPNPTGMQTPTFERARIYARKSGLIAVTDKDVLKGSLTYNLMQAGIPALTFELGEPRIINEKNLLYGIGAISNILSELEMIDPLDVPFACPLPAVPFLNQQYIYSDKPYCSSSGIIRFLKPIGREVKQTQTFAKIVNAFGKHLETLRAPQRGIILGYTDSAVVFPGTAVISMALPMS